LLKRRSMTSWTYGSSKTTRRTSLAASLYEAHEECRADVSRLGTLRTDAANFASSGREPPPRALAEPYETVSGHTVPSFPDELRCVRVDQLCLRLRRYRDWRRGERIAKSPTRPLGRTSGTAPLGCRRAGGLRTRQAGQLPGAPFFSLARFTPTPDGRVLTPPSGGIRNAGRTAGAAASCRTCPPPF
jgi:hypothetical protein